jgi:predicted nucleic acid-binding protein
MNPLIFLDTNVLVYAYDVDEGDKHKKAQTILRDCWYKENGATSSQVLQEFYSVATRKIPKSLAKRDARDVIRTYQAWPMYSITVEDIIDASELEEQLKYSFWDSLIIVAAQKVGAELLYSEDMQDGQQIGSLKIVNPFK